MAKQANRILDVVRYFLQGFCPITFISSALVTVALIVSAFSTPIKRNRNIDDTVVLNYALTLEHLENSFYSGSLANFDAAAFTSAGLPEGSRACFEQIAMHEQTHVTALSQALGKNAVRPCEYNFPYTDPKSFAAVSQILEGVGAGAYTGAARYIKNKDYLTVAASILSVEARHASYVAGAVNGVQPWSSAFETPLGFNQAYSLAASFITSCPKSNPPLPFKAFPALTVTPSVDFVSATVKYTIEVKPKKAYLAILNGFETTFIPITDSSAILPAGLRGTVYALITSDNKAITDSATITGPAILTKDF